MALISVREAKERFSKIYPNGGDPHTLENFVMTLCGLSDVEARAAIARENMPTGASAGTREQAPVPRSQGQRGPLRPIYSQCSEEWKKSPSLHAKFKHFGAFVAHRRAELNGQNARGAK